jgi:hypothetical protein
MTTVAQIEDSIQALSAKDFFQLLEWMCEKHVDDLAAGHFDSLELEAEILKGLEGPRYPVGNILYGDLRSRWGTTSRA